jgi:hypothetical protein
VIESIVMVVVLFVVGFFCYITGNINGYLEGWRAGQIHGWNDAYDANGRFRSGKPWKFPDLGKIKRSKLNDDL